MNKTEPKDPVAPVREPQVEPADEVVKASQSPVTIQNDRINIVNGGRLNVGNPGNKGGSGRPAERVRKQAAESWEKFASRIDGIIERVLAKIEAGLEGEARMKWSDVLAGLREVARAQAANATVGIPAKTEIILDSDGFIDAAADVLDEVTNDALLKTEVVRRLRDRLKG